MKVFLLNASSGDGYDNSTYVSGVFLSKKGLYKCMNKLLNECTRRQYTRSWRGGDGNVQWLIEDEDEYNSTIYSIEEIEAEE